MATVKKRGKSWYLNWSENRSQFRRSLGPISEQEALEILRIKKEELKTGESFKVTESVLFKDFAPEYLKWHSLEYPSSATRISQIVRDHLKPEFSYLSLQSISPRKVEAWKAARLLSGAAAGTVGKELRTLKSILNKAVAWEIIDRHRLTAVSEPKNLKDRPPPYYTADELADIYTASFQHGALWAFMANTGLRRGEVMQARRKDIVNGHLRVLSTNKARTKSAKWRLVPLSPGALSVLPSLGKDYLAPQIHPRSLSRAFEHDVNKANRIGPSRAEPIGGSIHWLRHTFCSHLVMAGVDLTTVQKLAGHSSYSTTLNYAHLAAGHLAEAVGGLRI